MSLVMRLGGCADQNQCLPVGFLLIHVFTLQEKKVSFGVRFGSYSISET